MTSGMWTAVFWQDTGERVISTFAAALLTEETGPAVLNVFPWLHLDVPTVSWSTALAYAGGMAFVTLLKCLTSSGVGDPTSASLLRRVRWTAPPGRHEAKH